jgi:hypothetical protein
MFIDPSDHEAVVWGLDLISDKRRHHVDDSMELG